MESQSPWILDYKTGTYLRENLWCISHGIHGVPMKNFTFISPWKFHGV